MSYFSIFEDNTLGRQFGTLKPVKLFIDLVRTLKVTTLVISKDILSQTQPFPFKTDFSTKAIPLILDPITPMARPTPVSLSILDNKLI